MERLQKDEKTVAIHWTFNIPMLIWNEAKSRTNGGEIVETFLSILILLVSVIIIVAVVLMESKQQGLGVIDGGANLYGQSSMGKDRMLNRVIIGATAAFMIIALVMAIVA